MGRPSVVARNFSEFSAAALTGCLPGGWTEWTGSGASKLGCLNCSSPGVGRIVSRAK